MAKLRLGTLIKRFNTQQEIVKKKSRDVTRAEAARDKEKAKLQKISNEIQDRFKNEEIKGYTTADGLRAELKPITGATVTDWNKLASYIYKNKALALLQRRINKANWLERLEARKNRPLPGVKKFQKVTLTVTKVKKR